MRKSRTIQCFEDTGLVHKFWKCHNSEFLLSPKHIKSLYNNCTKKALKNTEVSKNINIHAFCYMDNHVHLLCKYRNGVQKLSKFMQLAHSSFGMAYNKLNNRQGKVAIERPKTPVVEEGGNDQIYVHMYIEANPIRAGIVKSLKQLKNYKYSSFQYYAYGVRNEFTGQISEPDWYTRLGNTTKERQQKYLKLFEEYLDENGWVRSKTNYEILKDQGSVKFLCKRVFTLKTINRKRKQHRHLSPKEVLELFVVNGSG